MSTSRSARLRAALSLALALLMAITAALSVTASAASAAKKQALAYNRHSIGLSGVDNARELGGYVTTSGKTVKFGALLRTARLSGATKADKKKLTKTYKLLYDIDLRKDSEVDDYPDPELDGVTYVQLSNLGLGIPDVTFDSWEDFAHVAMATQKGVINMHMTNEYRQLVTDETSLECYREMFQLLLKANGRAVLWHCSSGKDRTGVAAILILSALGVDKETCIQDYMLTNYYLKEYRDDLEQDVLKYTGSQWIADDIKWCDGTRREWIETSFDCIDEHYGSMDNFLHEAMGLSNSDLKKLRKAYLQ